MRVLVVVVACLSLSLTRPRARAPCVLEPSAGCTRKYIARARAQTIFFGRFFVLGLDFRGAGRKSESHKYSKYLLIIIFYFSGRPDTTHDGSGGVLVGLYSVSKNEKKKEKKEKEKKEKNKKKGGKKGIESKIR